MPALPAAPAATDRAGKDIQPLTTPILITEQEVVFGTSAAAPLQHIGTTRGLGDAARIIVATLRRTFLTSTSSPRPARRDCPARYSYLERALMSREMDRL